METGAGPHPLRLFICLMPLCLALLLGPGGQGPQRKVRRLVAVLEAWMPKDRKLKNRGA